VLPKSGHECLKVWFRCSGRWRVRVEEFVSSQMLLAFEMQQESGSERGTETISAV
jgi:hypothetical protein